MIINDVDAKNDTLRSNIPIAKISCDCRCRTSVNAFNIQRSRCLCNTDDKAGVRRETIIATRVYPIQHNRKITNAIQSTIVNARGVKFILPPR